MFPTLVGIGLTDLAKYEGEGGAKKYKKSRCNLKKVWTPLWKNFEHISFVSSSYASLISWNKVGVSSRSFNLLPALLVGCN